MFFFFNDTATTEIYTLSLHDALPIFFPIREVADLTNIVILSAFVVVCVAVILFRYTRPDTPRSFRLPLMPVVPAFGVLASLFLIAQLRSVARRVGTECRSRRSPYR